MWAESGSDVTEGGSPGGSEGGGKAEFPPIPGFFRAPLWEFGDRGFFWDPLWNFLGFSGIFGGLHDRAQPVHLRPRRLLPLLQRVAPAAPGGHGPGGGVQADVRDAFLPALLRGQDESHGHRARAGRVRGVPHQQVPPALPGDALGAAPGAQHRPGRAQRPRGAAAHLQQPVRGAGGEEPSVPPPRPRAEPPVPAAPRRLRAQPPLLRAPQPQLSPKRDPKILIDSPKTPKS